MSSQKEQDDEDRQVCHTRYYSNMNERLQLDEYHDDDDDDDEANDDQ